MSSIACSLVETATEFEAALAVRHHVFVEEQGVAPELEIDEYDRLDGSTLHAVASRNGRIVATGRLRLLSPGVGKLERIAVLESERYQDVGRTLTHYLEELARRRGMTRLTLHSQDLACGFYDRLGYTIEGKPFLEAGIVHVAMSKDLSL